MMIGTTSHHPEILPQRISACFIHEVVMTTPNVRERVEMLEGLSQDVNLAPGVGVSSN